MRHSLLAIEPVAFAAALRKGLGRCVLAAQQAGKSASFRITVLTACQKHPAFDPLTEGTREVYLLELADAVGVRREVRDAVLAALPMDTDSWDTAHYVSLARVFALEGDPRARIALREQVRVCPSASRACWAFVDVDGTAGLTDESCGLLYVARMLGEQITKDNEWLVASLVDHANEQFGVEATQAALARAARTSSAVARFYEVARPCDAGNAPSSPKPSTYEGLSFDQLLLAIDSLDERKRRGSMAATRWGLRASPDELTRAAMALCSETAPARQALLLRIFHRAAFPLSPERLFALAQSEDAVVRQNAFDALAEVHHPSVRAFARASLGEPAPRREALRLFSKNAVAGDGAHVRSMLDAAPLNDEQQMHALGLALLGGLPDVLEAADWARPLEWLYEHGPCSYCRHSIVTRLADAKALAASTRGVFARLLPRNP